SLPRGAGPVRYVACPICKKIMNRQNFGRRSGVVIDVCKGHGVWFEHGELRATLAFIDSGGFERARQADEQRQIEERLKLVHEFNESGRIQLQIEYARQHTGGAPADTLLADALRMLFQ